MLTALHEHGKLAAAAAHVPTPQVEDGKSDQQPLRCHIGGIVAYPAGVSLQFQRGQQEGAEIHLPQETVFSG